MSFLGVEVWLKMLKMLNAKNGCLEKCYAHNTAWKVSKYGVISGPYFSVFELYTGKYGFEITPYLDTFHEV